MFNSGPVAVKALKGTVDVEEFKGVLAELKITAYLGDHEFIVKFVGAEISEIAKRKSNTTCFFSIEHLITLTFTGKLLIVTELSPYGDLLKYLWKVRQAGLGTELGLV